MSRPGVRGVVTLVLVVAVVVGVLVLTRGSDESAGAPTLTAPAEPQPCPEATSVPGVVVSQTTPAIDPAALPAAGSGFVRNAGQVDDAVRYYAVTGGLGVYVLDDEVVVALGESRAPEVLRLVPTGANREPRIVPRAARPGRASYFSGDERHTDLLAYGEVAYEELWPSIDLVLRTNGQGLKYEFEVAPGADTDRIGLTYRGADDVSLSAAGDLLIETGIGTLRDPRPVAYQDLPEGRTAVESRFTLDAGTGAFGIEVGPHDRSRPLVVDPGIEYSGLLGGTVTDFVRSMAVDEAGNIYVAGGTMSPDLPVTEDAPGPAYRGEPDAFVAKLDAGGEVVYQTYLSGTKSETALSIAIDDDGNAYVSGGSNSPDFPTTPGAFAQHKRNEDVWVVKLDRTGSEIVYGTFLPGTGIAGDFGNVVGVDDQGHAVVAGGSGSNDFPVTGAAFDRTHNGEEDALDAFVSKLEPDGSGLVYSTLIGGSCNDVVNGMTVTPSGEVHVVGSTASSDFPTTEGAVATRYHGGEDAFVVQLSEDGSALAYSSLLGGKGLDNARDIALGPDRSRYVTGWTSSEDLPAGQQVADPTFNGVEDGFLARISDDGEDLEYITYLGGAAKDQGWGVGVNDDGDAYVTGLTASKDYPVSEGALDPTANGDQDVFVSLLGPQGGSLLASTFLGGSGLDAPRTLALRGDDVYVAGRTSSPDFPAAGGGQAQLRGDRDGFVTRLRLR